ncbi:hypothetical protein MRX96_057418 [Rhipicephalus microplus]
MEVFFSATEHHNLSHTAVEKLFSELQLVFELVLKAYANEIAHAVKTLGADRELDLLLSCSFIPDLFKGLDKKRAREKYAKETFPFVAPEEQVLGQGATYHYVPLPKLLHVLCSIPDIGAHLKTPEPDNETPSVYRDYTDDEIEVVNPLGAKRGTHKLLAVYCCLLTLHARYRSKLQSIYLVMLVWYAYVKTYGLTPVLQPLLTDLNHLFDEGLTIDLEGITTNVGSFELRGFELYEGLSTTQSRLADWGMLPDCAKKCYREQFTRFSLQHLSDASTDVEVF